MHVASCFCEGVCQAAQAVPYVEAAAVKGFVQPAKDDSCKGSLHSLRKESNARDISAQFDFFKLMSYGRVVLSACMIAEPGALLGHQCFERLDQRGHRE